MPEEYRGAHRAPAETTDAGPDTEPSAEARPDPVDAADPDPLAVAEDEPQTDPDAVAVAEHEPETDPQLARPIPAPAQPVVVPGQYHYLKRWAFVLVLIAVWIPADAIGLALYYDWYHQIDKTWAVFLVLMYLVVCALAGLLLAMVEPKPLVAAMSIAVMSAPLASTAAAAALYGAYVFGWIAR